MNSKKEQLNWLGIFSIFASTIWGVYAQTASAQENFTYCRQAEIYLSQNKLDDAIPQYMKCLKDGNLTTATTSIVFRNLGLIYYNKKEFTQSISHFDEAIRLNAKDPWDDLVSRGTSWAKTGNFNNALNDYEEALRLNPNFAIANFNRGIAYEQLGKVDEAKKDFRQASDKGYRSPLLSTRLSFYRMTLQETSNASPIAPYTTDNEFMNFLGYFLNAEHGRTICTENASNTSTLMVSILSDPNFKEYRKANRARTATAIYTSFPCPFSPIRQELKPIDSNELEGVWVFPKNSQKYRFGPKSMAWQADWRSAIQCEVIGYYSTGEMRSVALSGPNTNCDISSANYLDQARQLPRVSSWNLIDNGRIRISRTDVKDHIEEWDAFIATSDFIAAGLEVKKGDLVTYLRKENGNSLNTSLTFRHLKKLP